MGPCPALCPLCLAPMSTFGTRSSHSGSLVIQSQPSAGAKRCKLCQLAPQNKNYESNKIYPGCDATVSESETWTYLPLHLKSLRASAMKPSVFMTSTGTKRRRPFGVAWIKLTRNSRANSPRKERRACLADKVKPQAKLRNTFATANSLSLQTKG